MYLLPEEFRGIDRLALLVLMTEGDDAEHGDGVGDAEKLLHVFFGGEAVSGETAAHLHPAGAETEILGLELHESGGYGRVLHPGIGEGGIGADHNCEAAALDRHGTGGFALGEALEHGFLVDAYKLPGAAVLGCGSQEGSLEYEFHVGGVDGLVGIFADAVAAQGQRMEVGHGDMKFNMVSVRGFRIMEQM